MIDGIGRELAIGDIVVRCAFGSYARVTLYQVVKFSKIKISVEELRIDKNNKTYEKVLNYNQEIPKISIDPSAVVKINEIIIDWKALLPN